MFDWLLYRMPKPKFCSKCGLSLVETEWTQNPVFDVFTGKATVKVHPMLSCPKRSGPKWLDDHYTTPRAKVYARPYEEAYSKEELENVAMRVLRDHIDDK